LSSYFSGTRSIEKTVLVQSCDCFKDGVVRDDVVEGGGDGEEVGGVGLSSCS